MKSQDEMKSEAVAEEEGVSKSDEVIVNAVTEIQSTLTSAFSDLANTVKALHEQVSALSKSIDSVKNEVTEAKGQFNEFGKRVDAVEQDTAFRKSGDLGEIVQESEPEKVQKSLWGGRFLKTADLFR
jgi:peptidoglycan hydrolase CwlO-like protein